MHTDQETDYARQRIDELTKLIVHHNRLYYELDAPSISDEQYDLYYAELVSLESQFPHLVAPSSPTKISTVKPSKGFRLVPHSFPMISLKTQTNYDSDAALEFDKKIREAFANQEVDYWVDPKYDGLAIDLNYVAGRLTLALTRGDYEIGEDVTENVRRIKDIPQTLTKEINIVVRGEIFMRKSVFAALNQALMDQGKRPMVNTRNAAAGAVRQHDPSVTEARQLSFYPYSVVVTRTDPDPSLSRHSQWMDELAVLGFRTNHRENGMGFLVRGDRLPEMHATLFKMRHKLDYDIDGVVYKVDSLHLQSVLGYTSKEPRWAIAHKFKAETAETYVESIDIQIGRTGKVTPVARLKPVFVGGTTITNVTLHNFSEIQRKDIRVGDSILVRRAGDVIPEILCVVIREGVMRQAPFVPPVACPECGSHLSQNEGEIDTRCTNHLNCPAQTSSKIEHFTSRNAMNIRHLGGETIDKLIEMGHLAVSSDLYCLGCRVLAKKSGLSIADLLQTISEGARYQLAYDTLMSIDCFGAKNTARILASIQQSKQTTLERVIYALGIRHVGQNTSRALAKHCKTMDAFIHMDEGPLNIADIGPETEQSIRAFVASPDNREQLYVLELCGVKPEYTAPIVTSFEGLKTLITGKIGTYAASDIENNLISMGIEIQAGVNKETSVLLVGENPGSKLEKAKNLEIPILDYQGKTPAIADILSDLKTYLKK